MGGADVEAGVEALGVVAEITHRETKAGSTMTSTDCKMSDIKSRVFFVTVQSRYPT